MMGGNKHEARRIFTAALVLDTPDERARYLDEACRGNPELRQRVEALLKAHDEAGGFLEQTTPVPPPRNDFATERAGEMIGRYKLLQEIGEGGFGVVFMAEQKEPVQRKVALKIIKAGMDTKEVVARFEAERQVLALMDHPNIAQVFDGGVTEASRPYFVMELVKGVPITDYCDRGNLPMAERLQLFMQVCHAVQHAHQKGIIHRDLKPSNILITMIDGKPAPKIIDFGVAKALGQQLTEKTLFTAFEQIVGTPLYMSPEQTAISGVDVDTRSDIYSLGVLLYELLTGSTPIDAETVRKAGLDEVRRMIRETDPPVPSTRLRTLGDKLTEVAQRRHVEPSVLTRMLHGDLDWIVMKALEKDRTRRYETVNSLLADIQRHLDHQPVEASPPSMAYRAKKYVRRHRMGVTLAASVTVALIAGLVTAMIGFMEAQQERDRALAAEEQSIQERDRALAAESEAQEQRDLAKTFATESHRRLVRRYVTEGNRLVEEGDLFSALLPFAMALKEDKDEASRADLHRLRLSTTLQQCPTLEVACFHRGAIYYAEFSPDGSRIVTASLDRTAQVWNAATGSPLAPPLQHSSDVNSASFSPDGKWVVTASTDGTAQIWSANTGERHGSALRHPGPVRSASFSPDNRWVVTTCVDGFARLWDAATGKQYGKPFEHRGGMRGAGFSSDGGRILVTSHNLTRVWTFDEERNLELSLDLNGHQAKLSPDGGRVLIQRGDHAEIWDVVTGQRIIGLRATGNTGDGPTASFSPDGKRVATVSSTRTGQLVRIWDASTGELVAPPLTDPGKEPIKAQSFSPDGRRLLTASGSTVRIWDVETGQLAFPPLTHGGVVRSATFSRDGQRVLTSSSDYSARIWNLAGGELARPSVAHPHMVNRIVLHPDARRVMTISVDGTAVFWDLESADVTSLPAINLTAVSHADFSPDGRLLALAKTDGTGGVWDLSTGRPVGSPMSHQGRVNFIEFSSDGRRVVTAGADGAVRIWRLNPGELITQMSHPGPVNFASFSPDGQRVVSTMVNTPDELLWGPQQPFVWPQEGLIATGAEVRCWDATSGQMTAPPLVFSNDVTEIVLSPDQLHAITACSKSGAPGRLAYTGIWDLSGGRNTSARLLHEATLVRGEFSPDGRRVVTSGRDRTTRMWDATTGKMLTVPMEGGFSDCTFSPDGRLVATASASAPEVRLWEAATGRLVGPPWRVRPEGAVNRIAFSPDGEFLVVATGDNQVLALKIGPAPRPLEDDLLLAQMLTGRPIEESDLRQVFDRGRLRWAWERLHVRYPEEFGVTWEQLESRFREEQLELKKVLGDNNPQLAFSLTTFAEILHNEGKWTEAETLYRESSAIRRKVFGDDHPVVARALADLAIILRIQGKLKEMKEVWLELAAGTNALALNNTAWHLATSRDPNQRDGQWAVKLAEQAVAATGRTNAMFLDTLAAAYAEQGQFTNAIRVQNEAIALLEDSKEQEDYESRQRLFECDTPYRQ